MAQELALTRHFLILFLILIFAMLVAVSSLASQETFSLEGELIQGTANADPLPGGLAVRLDILDEAGERVKSYQTVSGPDGTFRFEDVAQYDAHRYVLATNWAGIEQTTIPYLLMELPNPLFFTLYETTTSLQNVVASRGNLRIEFDTVSQVGLSVLLELRYGNVGDRIVYAEDGSLSIELPVGAFGIAPEEAPGAVQRYASLNEIEGLPIPAIRDTQPLLPGIPNVLRASFFVPYEDGAVIDMRFPIAVTDFGIFVREDTVSIQSDLLSLTDQQETSSGKTYFLYALQRPLAPDEGLIFTLQGEPIQLRVASASADSNADGAGSLLIILVLGIGTIALAMILWFIRARQGIGH